MSRRWLWNMQRRLKINPNVKFIIFDTLEVNFTYYYLKRHGFNINFNNYKN